MRKRKKSTKLRKRKSKTPLFVLLGILSGLAIFIVWWAFTLPYFYIKHVNIQGLHRISSQQLLKKNLVPPHTSIFEVDIQRVSQKIKQEPVAKKVSIEKKLPSTLLINIEERVPYAYAGEGGKLWEVDEEGVVLGKVKEVDRRENHVIVEGVNPFEEKEVLSKALSILKKSQPLDLEVKKVKAVGGDRGIVLVLRENIKVVMGTSPRYSYLSSLPYVFKDARRREEKFNSVDLRFDGQIVLSYEPSEN